MENDVRLIDANALDLRNRVATDMGGMCFIEDVETAIEQAPTIDPESLRPAWIPVTERLPLVELEGIKDSEVYHCLVCVNPIVGTSAASIINKHGDYAAAGIPVINTQASQEYRELVAQYHMGLNCNNEDADDMADKLEQLILNPQLRLEMGKNARKCAEERFDRVFTYREILKILQV
jgi:glycosyltransferase involved in cell wall biosynthesis